VFERHEIGVPHVLASACLPFIFQAVEINGEHYWDGGYVGNPAIFPLIYGCESRDIVVVHINPIERDEAPRAAAEILDRVNEISFNSSLMREMRAISFVTRLLDERLVDGGRLKRVFIHSISADEVMKKLGVSTKLNADWGFLTHLHAAGRRYSAGAESDDGASRPNPTSSLHGQFFARIAGGRSLSRWNCWSGVASE
jgi:NTE family protein